MHNILITGGAGFIGSCLAEKLLGLNNSVVCLDNFQEPYSDLKKSRIAELRKNENFKVIEGDIIDTEFLKNLIAKENIDIVLHEAAKTGVRESLKIPFVYNKLNIDGTLSVLNACINSNVKRIIHASATSVFGNPKYTPIDETHPKNPISPYGLSKLAAESYVQMYNQLYGLPTVVLRYFTVYGQRGRPESVITRFIVRAIFGSPLEIYGNGEQSRGFTFVDDIVSANIAAIEKQKAIGEDFNIGGDVSIKINDLAEKILHLTGSKSKVTHLEANSGEITESLADTEKARQILDWKRKTDLEDGLAKTHEWFKNNAQVYFRYCCE